MNQVYLTKFRAFQLDSPGSLFSFYKPGEYTLIEARLPIGGIETLLQDMSFHAVSSVNVLHITSWDVDHCNYNDLVQILNHLRPQSIEVPDYLPESTEGQLCRSVLFKYDDIHQRMVHNVKAFSPAFFASLQNADAWGTNNVVWPSKVNRELKNDMSSMQMFRSEGFNVLSLGDLDSRDIAVDLSTNYFIQNEVDVLILPHHGANNGFTCPELLEAMKPRMAVCSSNYDNQFDHPRPEICSMLNSRSIPLMTTKRGDVIIYQTSGMQGAVAANMASNNEVVETRKGFVPKRMLRS